MIPGKYGPSGGVAETGDDGRCGSTLDCDMQGSDRGDGNLVEKRRSRLIVDGAGGFDLLESSGLGSSIFWVAAVRRYVCTL